MKKYLYIIGIFICILFSSQYAYASENIPYIYFDGTKINTSEDFFMENSTVYISTARAAKLFNTVLSVDKNNIVYTFSNNVRTVTYDSVSGSVNIGDRNSFMYTVLGNVYPSIKRADTVYVPIRMMCYGLRLDIKYIDACVQITSSKGSVGLFNNEGTAISYNAGKYGLVNSADEVLLKFAYSAISNYDNTSLYKVTYNHRCGLANSKGELLTEIIYSDIYYESPSHIYLEQGNLKGMCDISGNMIVPVQYDDVSYCDNKIAMVKMGKKWYILNCKTGIISHKSFDEVYKITAGIQSDNDMIKGYYVKKNNKWGCVDSFGNIVIDIKYDALDKFDEYGRARVILDGKFGIIDCGGTVIIPTAYDYIDSFGKLKVTTARIGDKYGIINDKFSVVVPFEYDYIYSFNNEYSAVAYKDGKFGLISLNGKPLTDFEYTYMEDFKNGLALAYKGGYGYIDHAGNEIIDCIHSDVKQGTALSVFLKKDGRWALFSPVGENLTGYNYVSAGSFVNGLSAVSVMTDRGAAYGYVNDSGDVIIPFIYSAANDFYYGKAIVSKGRYCGIINVDGEIVIPFVYTGFNPSYDYNVIAAANEYSKWGLISFNNKKLTEFEYDYIFEFENGFAVTLKNHLYGIIDQNGNVIIDNIYKTKEAVMAASFL